MKNVCETFPLPGDQPITICEQELFTLPEDKTLFMSTPKHICTTRSRLPLLMPYIAYWFIAPSIKPFQSIIISKVFDLTSLL